MSTPEIDLANMLDDEDAAEKLDDQFQDWMDETVIPDLTKYLKQFDYNKFDKAVQLFKMHLAPDEGIIYWLKDEMADDLDKHFAFMMRDRLDVDFKDMAKRYTDSFAILDSYLEWRADQ